VWGLPSSYTLPLSPNPDRVPYVSCPTAVSRSFTLPLDSEPTPPSDSERARPRPSRSYSAESWQKGENLLAQVVDQVRPILPPSPAALPLLFLSAY
jgi:hypothetical protein